MVSPVLTTAQDAAVIGLLSPARLLEFIRYFTLFDRKTGKIVARYQQISGVKSMLARVSERNRDGGREGCRLGTRPARASPTRWSSC